MDYQMLYEPITELPLQVDVPEGLAAYLSGLSSLELFRRGSKKAALRRMDGMSVCIKL